eukprot:2714254-Pyramimonas_sp.AAC.1
MRSAILMGCGRVVRQLTWVTSVMLRNYSLEPIGMEIFFSEDSEQDSIYFTFKSEGERSQFHKVRNPNFSLLCVPHLEASCWTTDRSSPIPTNELASARDGTNHSVVAALSHDLLQQPWVKLQSARNWKNDWLRGKVRDTSVTHSPRIVTIARRPCLQTIAPTETKPSVLVDKIDTLSHPLSPS